MRTLLFTAALLLATFTGAQSAQAAIQIDGVIEPAEWGDAMVYDQFVSLQPLNLEPNPAEVKTTAWLQSTPEGLAIAVRALQPPSVARIGTRVKRDFQDQVDRINFMVDFDGDGRSGYAFTLSAGNDISDEVITNEVQFNPDWDGNWQHAVRASDLGYEYELLIPYSITSMRAATDGKRTLAVYFDRVIATSGQRYGFPAASFTRPRFLSDFHRVEVPAFEQSLLATVPYVVALSDLKGNAQDYKVGADIFWKPSSNHQFALTINPDFGQVESDQLVVNFDAVETFFTDKRPFFTDNQAAFAGAYPGGNLFYTRRVGGPADDGSGSAQINAAIKANGSLQSVNYAVFAASEDGEAGRDFVLARAAHQRDGIAVDFTSTFVDRPFLDRQANVNALHVNYKPNEEWSFETAVNQSRVDVAGVSNTGYAGGVIADWDMPGPFRQQYFWIEVDERSNLNDLGFQDRNNFRYLEWENGFRQDELPKSSMFASHAWELELAQQSNGAGDPLRRDITFQRYSETRAGGNAFFFVRKRLPSFDDLISRNNGIVRSKGGWQALIEGNSAREEGGNFAFGWNLGAFPGRTTDRHNLQALIEPRWYVGDRFDVSLGLVGTRMNDWLLWRGATNFGRFKSKRMDVFANLNWFISDQQELRIKLENIAIDAELDQALRLQSNRDLIASNTAIDDFRLRNLGFQIRYRYKLGNLSDVFVVYSRGGATIDQQPDDVFGALRDSFELRDSDQFLIKLAYRFER